MTAAERRRRAYEAGFRGEASDPDWDADTLAAFDRGLNDADAPPEDRQGPGGRGAGVKTAARRTHRSSRRTEPKTATVERATEGRLDELDTRTKKPKGPRVGEGGTPFPTAGDIPKARIGGGVTVDDGAGFLLGLFVFALTRAFLQGGTAEARQWLGAKFLNHSSSGTAGTGPGSGSSPKTTPTAPSTSTTAPTPGSTSRTPPLVPGNFGGGS